jgi:hypothetical protein
VAGAVFGQKNGPLCWWALAGLKGFPMSVSIVPHILESVTISNVYRALGGATLPNGRRGVAFWRDGANGFNVSLNDTKGTWFDHAAGEGGGLLDLVVKVRGGTKQEAVRYLAALAGIPIDDDSPAAVEARARWAADREALRRDLPNAEHWRAAAIAMVELSLDSIKAGFFDPTAPRPDIGELQDLTRLLEQLHRLQGLALVDAYGDWWLTHPQLTAGLVHAGRNREAAWRHAIRRYLEVAA